MLKLIEELSKRRAFHFAFLDQLHFPKALHKPFKSFLAGFYRLFLHLFQTQVFNQFQKKGILVIRYVYGNLSHDA